MIASGLPAPWLTLPTLLDRTFENRNRSFQESKEWNFFDECGGRNARGLEGGDYRSFVSSTQFLPGLAHPSFTIGLDACST